MKSRVNKRNYRRLDSVEMELEEEIARTLELGSEYDIQTKSSKQSVYEVFDFQKDPRSK